MQMHQVGIVLGPVGRALVSSSYTKRCHCGIQAAIIAVDVHSMRRNDRPDRQARGLRRLRDYLPLGAAVVVAVVVAWSILGLVGKIDSFRTSQLQLARLATGITLMDALEWQAIADGGLTPEGRARINRAATDIEAVLASLSAQGGALGPELKANGSLGESLDAYRSAVSDEFVALAGGSVTGAREVDTQKVDPAFEAMSGELAMATSRYAVLAKSSRRRLEGAIVGALLLGAVTIGVAFSWSLRGRRRQTEAQQAVLAKSEARFRSLVQHSFDILTVVSADGTILMQSEATNRVLGYANDELLGTRVTGLIDPDELPRALETVNKVLREPGAPTKMNCRMRHSDGTWRSCETTMVNLIDDPNVGGIVLNTRDVTERRSLEQQLRRQAFHDELTGLANRALLMERVEHAVTQRGRWPRPLALLMLDLDDFKSVNDSLGHGAGNELLIEVAARLAPCVRATDTLARLGGDEFAVLLDDVLDVTYARQVADRILVALAGTFMAGDQELLVHVSVGIAFSPAGGEGTEDLLRDADAALYAAKDAGKNRVEVFNPTMHAAALERLQLGAELRQAIGRGELRVQYQPIVDLGSAQWVGAEALVRWRHPTRGTIPPLDFIPLAERNGLIVPLGRWVLEQACGEAMTWPARPGRPAPYVTVNLSGRQLQDAELLADVEGILGESGLDPARLTFEITESVMMGDGEEVCQKLSDLKALGVRLAVDDFGTGYSSLAYLQRFPIDVLKIDRSFVERVTGGTEESAVAQAIVHLGHAMSLATLAEGIETPEQAAALQALGCDLAQGYLFGRPMEPEELRAGIGSHGRAQRLEVPEITHI
jgi:diguanylate cyclase (GGDEF)-like protein/PAS domain S-box-containing protein